MTQQSSHIAVNPDAHKNVYVSRERSGEMGDNHMACFTFPDEFRSIQNEFAILFQRSPENDNFTCVAMLGFQNGENLYLNDTGWGADYIPMAMDVPPFLIGRTEQKPDEKTMVIDMNHPRVSTSKGERLFDSQGQATPFLKSMTQKLGQLNRGYEQSQHYIKALKKYDLLEALSIDVGLRDGSKSRLIGFHTIHEEKFLNLETAAIDELHKEGWLLPSFMVLASLSNLSRLAGKKDKVEMQD